jgi:hypothetical protein
MFPDRNVAVSFEERACSRRFSGLEAQYESYLHAAPPLAG